MNTNGVSITFKYQDFSGLSVEMGKQGSQDMDAYDICEVFAAFLISCGYSQGTVCTVLFDTADSLYEGNKKGTPPCDEQDIL